MTKSPRRPAGRGMELASLALIVASGALFWFARQPDAQYERPALDRAEIHRFGMFSFGASGVAVLPDGRLIVVEDEKVHPLVLVDLFGSRPVKEFAPAEVAAAFAPVQALSDLEGITTDPRHHLYATTSQTITKMGVERVDRDWVVRFDIAGDQITAARSTGRLTDAVAALDAGLAASIGLTAKTLGPAPGLDVEGIAWDPRTGRLLFGLRGPLRDGKAIVIGMENPDPVFESGATPILSGPFTIDLEGQGIRDLTYVDDLGGFLLVAGASGKSDFGQAELWLWGGPAAPAPKKLRTPILDGTKPEGITAVTVSGHRLLVFVCDDGVLDSKYYEGKVGRNAGTPSRYIVLPYDVLLSDNPGLRVAR